VRIEAWPVGTWASTETGILRKDKWTDRPLTTAGPLIEAQADLQATKAQITGLIDKYLGVPDGSGLGPTSQTTSSTAWVKPLPD
jgi:hypothetical protein